MQNTRDRLSEKFEAFAEGPLGRKCLWLPGATKAAEPDFIPLFLPSAVLLFPGRLQSSLLLNDKQNAMAPFDALACDSSSVPVLVPSAGSQCTPPVRAPSAGSRIPLVSKTVCA